MIPSDTQLAIFVREIGDYIMEYFVTSIYASPLVGALSYIAGIIFLCALALSLVYPQYLKYAGSFIIAWVLILPYNKQPLAYHVVNALSVSASTHLQKMVYGLFNGKSYPPNYIFNAIYRAGSASIKDVNLKRDVHDLIENCIPHGVNNRGERISAADIFSGEMTYDYKNKTSVITYPFNASYLTDLSSRTFSRGQDEINCKKLLTETNHSLRKDLAEIISPSTDENLYVGANNGDGNEEVKSWDMSEDNEVKIKNVALNLAHATSLQKMILEDVFGKKIDFGGNIEKTIHPSIELTQKLSGESNFNPTKVMLSILNLPSAIGRSFNIDGFYSSANALQEMNERLHNLPYYISYVQIILKIVVAIILLTALFGTWRYVILWSTCWFLTLNVPWILMLSRIITNYLLISFYKLKEQISSVTNPNFLSSGVDFYAAAEMLNDTSRAANVFINCEKAIWASMFFIIPAASWFAVGKIHNSASTALGHIGGLMTRKVASKVGSTTTKVAKGVGLKVLKHVPGVDKVSTVASVATSSPFKSMKSGKLKS